MNNIDGFLNKENIEQLKKTENVKKMVDGLSDEQKQKLNNILNDKQALENVLKSPQAIALLKLFGNKG